MHVVSECAAIFLYPFPHQGMTEQGFNLELGKIYVENELLRQPLDGGEDMLCCNIL